MVLNVGFLRSNIFIILIALKAKKKNIYIYIYNFFFKVHLYIFKELQTNIHILYDMFGV